jgi:hypothetical protein
VFQNPIESRFKNITKRKIKAFVDPIHISGPPSWTQAVANLLIMIIEGRGSEKLKIIARQLSDIGLFILIAAKSDP